MIYDSGDLGTVEYGLSPTGPPSSLHLFPYRRAVINAKIKVDSVLILLVTNLWPRGACLYIYLTECNDET